ncbi:putative hydrolase [Gordonia araii NBRC 100433]|uniref:Nuclease SbcCD subunit D n=1 Tax=Gordonia araii NBRC 100433 TaxID=1073574 RepID=G7H6N3_9ACTN|nr:metallophosphoesterase [Gordonia araii]NNG98597.1 DNA repair exonuclease [Gordonia araii NBRC 100433]GAB11508.1 putative hydrolase [Gordonia araii NBRC 100433]
MTAATLFDDPNFDDARRAPDRSVTFVHTADWQLGMTRHFLPPEAQALFTADRLGAIERIGDVAATAGAEFVVVCGDVFEDHRVSSRIVTQALDRLRDFPVPVYLLPGNHDPYDAASIYRSEVFTKRCPDNVVVLSTPGAHEVADGIDLVVAPWSTKSPTSDLVADQVSRLPGTDRIRIVLGHGGTDELSPSSGPAIVAVPPLDRALADEVLDFVALGDRHSVTKLGTTGRIWYSGAHEVTNFDNVETGSGEVLVVSLARGSRRTVEVAQHPVGRWRFRSMTVDVNGTDDVEALSSRLDEIPDKSTTVVRLGLVGTLSIADHTALSELLDAAADRFAAVVRWDACDDLRVVADPGDVDGLGLRGYAAEAAGELVSRANAADDAESRAARDALALLGRLAGGGDR